MSNNRMQSQMPMHLSPRCRAKSKRSGKRCKSPAVAGWNVCRMHGARGGAPKGNANGNYRYGYRTQKAQQQTRELREAVRSFRALAAMVETE
jgi:glucans biosynthesis protein